MAVKKSVKATTPTVAEANRKANSIQVSDTVASEIVDFFYVTYEEKHWSDVTTSSGTERILESDDIRSVRVAVLENKSEEFTVEKMNSALRNRLPEIYINSHMVEIKVTTFAKEEVETGLFVK